MYLMQEDAQGVPFQYSGTCPPVQGTWQLLAPLFK